MNGDQAATSQQVFIAAGHKAERRQVSSTWLIRATIRPMLVIANRDAGGELAHITLHQDGWAHVKVQTGPKRTEPMHRWRLQDPLDGSDTRRLAEIIIPHSGLVPVHDNGEVHPSTLLVAPPLEGQQLVFTVLSRPGRYELGGWPGRTTLDSRFVAAMTVHAEDGYGMFHFVVVATYWPESADAVNLARARLVPEEGVVLPDAPRVVTFTPAQADGDIVPTLMEMPVGHLREPDHTSGIVLGTRAREPGPNATP